MQVRHFNPNHLVNVVIRSRRIADRRKSQTPHLRRHFLARRASNRNNVELRNDRFELASHFHEALKGDRGAWKKPVMKRQTVEILQPVPVVCQVVPFKPPLACFIKVKFVFRFTPPSLGFPFPGKLRLLQPQVFCLRPGPKHTFLQGPNHPVYRDPPRAPFCDASRVRVLPCLIRSYCLMASATDRFGCRDKTASARSSRRRW